MKILLILVLTLVVCLFELASSKQSDQIKGMYSKLEIKCVQPRGGSGLTLDDMRLAYKQFQTWTEEEVKEVTRDHPRLRLVLDFAMIPMKRFIRLVDGSENKKELYGRFIKRLEETYCRFKPIYSGKMCDHLRSPKTSALHAALYDVTGEKVLNKKLVKDANLEYEVYKAKADEIIYTEDVYASANDLELLMCYLNLKTVKAMTEAIFPIYKSIPEEQILKLKSIYRGALRR